MAAAGIAHENIAKCLGTDGIDPKTMRLHFRRELDISRDQVTAVAMGKLVAAMNAGEAWAICFWMKCRAEWSERQRHEFVGAPGPDGRDTPATLVIEYVNKPYADRTPEPSS